MKGQVIAALRTDLSTACQATVLRLLLAAHVLVLHYQVAAALMRNSQRCSFSQAVELCLVIGQQNAGVRSRRRSLRCPSWPTALGSWMSDCVPLRGEGIAGLGVLLRLRGTNPSLRAWAGSCVHAELTRALAGDMRCSDHGATRSMTCVRSARRLLGLELAVTLEDVKASVGRGLREGIGTVDKKGRGKGNFKVESKRN